MNLSARVWWWSVLAMLPLAAIAHSERADRIFVNGKLWTGDDARPTAEALAVAGDRIIAVGSSREIQALAGPQTVSVDLRGRRVVPGFQDSHLHFPGPSINSVALDGLESLAAFQKALGDFARTHPELAWISGSGWGYSAFPNQEVHRKYIDAVIPDRPVYVTERDGHMGLANSRALALAGITRDTPDPPNGHIMRDAQGEPTGELKEAAQSLMRKHIPQRSSDEMYQSFSCSRECSGARLQ